MHVAEAEHGERAEHQDADPGAEVATIDAHEQLQPGDEGQPTSGKRGRGGGCSGHDRSDGFGPCRVDAIGGFTAGGTPGLLPAAAGDRQREPTKLRLNRKQHGGQQDQPGHDCIEGFLGQDSQQPHTDHRPQAAGQNQPPGPGWLRLP